MIDERTLDIISSCWVKFRRVQTVTELDDQCKHVICTFLLKIATDDPTAFDDPELAADIQICRKHADPEVLARVVIAKVEQKCGSDIECYEKYSPSEVKAMVPLVKTCRSDFKDDIAKLLSQHCDYTDSDWHEFIKIYRSLHARKMRVIKQLRRVESRAEDEVLREIGPKVEKIRL